MKEDIKNILEFLGCKCIELEKYNKSMISFIVKLFSDGYYMEKRFLRGDLRSEIEELKVSCCRIILMIGKRVWFFYFCVRIFV